MIGMTMNADELRGFQYKVTINTVTVNMKVSQMKSHHPAIVSTNVRKLSTSIYKSQCLKILPKGEELHRVLNNGFHKNTSSYEHKIWFIAPLICTNKKGNSLFPLRAQLYLLYPAQKVALNSLIFVLLITKKGTSMYASKVNWV